MEEQNINPLDTEESIADLAGMLFMLENAEQLAELKTVPEFIPSRLNRAAKRLSKSKYQQIRDWAIQNRQALLGKSKSNKHIYLKGTSWG